MPPPKWFFLQPDGASDEPQSALGGRTPLAAAHTPNLDRLAREGACFRVQSIPDELPPGSDVGNMSLLGYDPRSYYTGRSPIEAAALGIQLEPGEVAIRCNLVHTAGEGDARVMVDFSAGHIDTDTARELITAIAARIEDARLIPGVSYRHVLIARLDTTELKTVPPHDIQDQPVAPYLPQGSGAESLRRWMDVARDVLRDHPITAARRAAGELEANDIWLWGQGGAVTLPPFHERHGWRGAMITAVDLLRGLATLTGMEILDVPGATGFIDTNYAGKAAAALAADVDFVFLHLEAPDESSHIGRLDYKLEALERFDAEIVGPIVAHVETHGGVVLVSPDHPTLLRTKTHARADVPGVAWGPGVQGARFPSYHEEIASNGPHVLGWEWLDHVRRLAS